MSQVCNKGSQCMSTEVLERLVSEVHSLSHDLKQRVEDSDKEQKKYGEALTSKNASMFAEMKEIVERINARINEVDAKYEAFQTEQKQAQIAANRPPLFGHGRQKRSPAHQAWMKAIKTRDGGMHLTQEEKALVLQPYMPHEQKALYAADATTGGYFAATDFLDELIAYQILISKFRGIARTQATSGEKVQMPALANDTTVFWATEQAAFADSKDPTTGMIEIPVHEMRALLKISQQNLEDSQFNLEDFMTARMMLGFAQKEGTAFIRGTGQGQPRGIMTYPTKATTSYTRGGARTNKNTQPAVADV